MLSFSNVYKITYYTCIYFSCNLCTKNSNHFRFDINV